jgi:murein DD-endopeptidase MepM/ murein hydrolase activator NlpD
VELTAKIAKDSGIGLPIRGLRASDIQDTFGETRGGVRQHEACDILAPRGTPVHAVVNGVVKKLFLSKPGGLTLYQFDEREEFSYYYAHLDRYAGGVEEGRMLKRGDVLGFVGSTGNANPKTPHLHFAIFALKPDKKWWEGTPVNPYPLLMSALRAELGL